MSPVITDSLPPIGDDGVRDFYHKGALFPCVRTFLPRVSSVIIGLLGPGFRGPEQLPRQ